jgi:hypothetical protein
MTFPLRGEPIPAACKLQTRISRFLKNSVPHLNTEFRQKTGVAGESFAAGPVDNQKLWITLG